MPVHIGEMTAETIVEPENQTGSMTDHAEMRATGAEEPMLRSHRDRRRTAAEGYDD